MKRENLIKIYLMGLYCKDFTHCKCLEGMSIQQRNFLRNCGYTGKRPCCVIITKEPTFDAAISVWQEVMKGQLSNHFLFGKVVDTRMVNEFEFDERNARRIEILRDEKEEIR